MTSAINEMKILDHYKQPKYTIFESLLMHHWKPYTSATTLSLFQKLKALLIEVLQCKYPGKYQEELCGGWRGVLDRRANGSMSNSPLLSSRLCQVASSKPWKEKGQRSIHAVTLGIPCVVMGCVMTAMKPWCAIDCYRTLKTIGHYLASISIFTII